MKALVSGEAPAKRTWLSTCRNLETQKVREENYSRSALLPPASCASGFLHVCVFKLHSGRENAGLW